MLSELAKGAIAYRFDSEKLIRSLGRVAGTGHRLGRDIEPTSRLGSLETNERNYWVAHCSRSEPRRPDWPVLAVGVTDALRMCGWPI